MAIMTLILASTSACNSNEPQTVYDNSVDVHLSGWASTDTLFYDIVVTDPPSIKNPIVVGKVYQLSISLRHTAEFPLNQVPFLLQMQQTDTIGGYVHPTRNILKEHFSPYVRDSIGLPLGDTWGSLIARQEHKTGVHIHFDTTGTYRFLIIPEIGDLPSLPGLASIGLRLSE